MGDPRTALKVIITIRSQEKQVKYQQQKDGDWIRPVRKEYRLVCCDCGVVHRLNFRVRKRHIEFQAFRDDRATGQIRRNKRAKEKP